MGTAMAVGRMEVLFSKWVVCEYPFTKKNINEKRTRINLAMGMVFWFVGIGLVYYTNIITIKELKEQFLNLIFKRSIHIKS
jgi:hypothetical protein